MPMPDKEEGSRSRQGEPLDRGADVKGVMGKGKEKGLGGRASDHSPSQGSLSLASGKPRAKLVLAESQVRQKWL